MLVLTRKRDQAVVIGDDIIVKIVEVKGDTVKIGIEAPRDITVHRQEVYDDIKKENVQASKVNKNAMDELLKLTKGSAT